MRSDPETVQLFNMNTLTLGRTSKLVPPLWHKVGGGMGGWEFMELVPRVFVVLQYFQRFYL